MPLIVTGKKSDGSFVFADKFVRVYRVDLQNYQTFDFPRKDKTRIMPTLFIHESAEQAEAEPMNPLATLSYGVEHDPVSSFSADDVYAMIVAEGIPAYSGWEFDSVAEYVAPIPAPAEDPAPEQPPVTDLGSPDSTTA